MGGRHGEVGTEASSMTQEYYTGMGCDLCGFGTIENTMQFNPLEPCPKCNTLNYRCLVKECAGPYAESGLRCCVGCARLHYSHPRPDICKCDQHVAKIQST